MICKEDLTYLSCLPDENIKMIKKREIFHFFAYLCIR